MRAIMITIAGHKFLLPERDDVVFPDIITDNMDNIIANIEQGQKDKADFLAGKYLLADPVKTPEQEALSIWAKAFREQTGIIGYPFTLSDAELYAIDRGVKVVLSVDLEGK